MQLMLCNHLIEFFGEIESQEQGSWAEARSFVDHYRPARTVDPDGLCAGPLPIGLTLKPVQKLHFGHHGSLLIIEEPTTRMNGRGRRGKDG